MNTYKVEIGCKNKIYDISGHGIKSKIKDLGISTVKEAIELKTFYFEGDLTLTEMETICQKFLADPIIEEYAVNSNLFIEKSFSVIEINTNPGVLVLWSDAIKKGVKSLGIKKYFEVKTGRKYLLGGTLSKNELDLISEKLLYNKVIEHRIKDKENIIIAPQKPEYAFTEVPILNSTDEELVKLSQNRLWLDLNEMKAIRSYFQKIKRNPTDVELEHIAAAWGEHCVHKTFKADIIFNGRNVGSLFKMIKNVTQKLNRDYCLSVFIDNSGVIKFDNEHGICFKVETHNRPSALEPYGGAITGIVGVNRDPFGTGLGARLIFNTDTFCFGPLDYPYEKLPAGVLHPKRIMAGVVAGVKDGGNNMGIPTVNGGIYFDERYLGNPLVYCGTGGIMPIEYSKKTYPKVNDHIIMVGGRVGRDGLHGATFSSGELTSESEKISSGSVQIGNPIVEKKMFDILLKCRDLKLYRAITDCGAAGLASAVGEMGEKTGVKVNLEKVPLKYSGLSAWEIWLSEAQERIILAVPPENVKKLIELCGSEDVEATDIGIFSGTGRLELFYEDKQVSDLDLSFVSGGLPKKEMKAVWNPTNSVFVKYSLPDNLTGYLENILSMPNICSKEAVIRCYDHEVQAGSVIKPLVGCANDGPGDAAVIKPLLDSNRGIAVSSGMNPLYGDLNPENMAASAVNEALRQIISIGGDPFSNPTGILGNYSWGNPNKPDRLGSLYLATKGYTEACYGYGIPIISGKDSLNNEYALPDGTTICIPPTLLISAISVIPDVNDCITMDVKSPGNKIYLVGKTYRELGGSHYYLSRNIKGGDVPFVRVSDCKYTMTKLHQAITKKTVVSCHDCSEGGLLVAAAEMAFAGGYGMNLHIRNIIKSDDLIYDDEILFSESNSRFVVEVPVDKEKIFKKMMSDVDISELGFVLKDAKFIVHGIHEQNIIVTDIWTLKKCWQKTLKYKKDLAKKIETIKNKIKISKPSKISSKARVLVVRTAGTNCDTESVYAFESLKATVDLKHINEIVKLKDLNNYQIIVIPGGFSYGDHISAGMVLAKEMESLKDKLLEKDKLVLGICNGFQVLVKMGILPGFPGVTLTWNTSGTYQCEWINLKANKKSPCIFTKGIDYLEVPIAHGEGRFITANKKVLDNILKNNLHALQYHKYNPNGSQENIAGLCNEKGNIFGLMPHPERHMQPTQHPRWTREGKAPGWGIKIFQNALDWWK
ncbi:MAG: phosphoribosylformylglycinamidine synthase subunit PurL [bacterium]|nr:phosphoribosylformylglycinamidine synthase subunit PurL [bacterium]